MKRILAITLAALMILGAASAAEIVRLTRDERLNVDLDGDGSEETVLWKLQPGPDSFEDSVQLFIEDISGGIENFSTEITHGCSCLVTDLDGDGKREIFISGDVASDDYYTWAFVYGEEGIKTIPWRNTARSDETTAAYISPGYGRIDALSSDNALTLGGLQDVLGTWYCARDFAFKGDRFDTSDDGLYRVTQETLWEDDCCLILGCELEVTIGDDEATLKAGEKLCLTAADKTGTAYFITEDGREGSFGCEPNPGDWGSLVGGLPEEEVFSFLPYSD